MDQVELTICPACGETALKVISQGRCGELNFDCVVEECRACGSQFISSLKFLTQNQENQEVK